MRNVPPAKLSVPQKELVPPRRRRLRLSRTALECDLQCCDEFPLRLKLVVKKTVMEYKYFRNLTNTDPESSIRPSR